MTHVVAVSAHPDDVEISAGGTLAKLRRAGRSILIVDLTDGEPTPKGSRETRLREAAAAAEAIGAERVTLGFRNRYLEDTLEARRALASILRERRPEILLSPYPAGAHPDHGAASRIADAARFYGKLTKDDFEGKPWPGEPWWVPRHFQFDLGATREVPRPSFIVDISDAWEAKVKALACYVSQGFMDRFLARPDWGAMIGAAHGEAFFSKGPIGLDDLFAARQG